MTNGSIESFFQRVMRNTPTEFWINNATPEEAGYAIAAGALIASTNPTYPSRLLRFAPNVILPLLHEVIRKTEDDNLAADIVYQRLVCGLAELFLPLYLSSNGRYGYVAIQGDPNVNNDPKAIIEGGLRYRRLGENIIIKVPSTPAGAEAMEYLVSHDHPTIATLGFSVDQAVYMAHAYERGLAKSKNPTPCYITYIAGILDEHLADAADRIGKPELKKLLPYAGCHGTRVAYKIFNERHFKALLVGGGARGPLHFFELIGGKMAITIGWDLAEQLMELNPPIELTIYKETQSDILRELELALPDFRKSIHEGSLNPDEFIAYSPVVRFQKTFLNGKEKLIESIQNLRTEIMMTA